MNRKDSFEKFSAEEICEIFSQVLGINSVNINDNFFDLGGDSFDAIRVVAKLGNKIRVVDVFENPTAEKLAEYFLGKRVNNELRLVRLNEVDNDSSIALIGVPYGGGDPTIFRNLFSDNKHIKVYGIYFGNSKIGNASEFEDLLNKLIYEIEKIDAKEFIIYGHCAGASTSACLASLLRKKQYSVRLVVAASKPIDDPDGAILEASKTSDYQWSQYLRSLEAFTGLNDDETNEMLICGRRDHFISVEGYRKLLEHPAYNVDALLLLGDADKATPNPLEIIEEWNRYIKVDKAKILNGLGHYFIRTHYKEISDIILSFIEK